MMAKLTNQQIEDISIKYVMDYLESTGEDPRKQPRGHGADIISNGKYIDVKGCLKKATNLRMCVQVLDDLEKKGKLKQGSFYIYYVFDIASGNPKLMIFDYNDFKKHKVEEIKWLIQPHRIKMETGKPDIIDLPKLKSE
jgi:hypothetical protein